MAKRQEDLAAAGRFVTLRRIGRANQRVESASLPPVFRANTTKHSGAIGKSAFLEVRRLPLTPVSLATAGHRPAGIDRTMLQLDEF